MQQPSIVENLSFQEILAAKKAKLVELDPTDAANLTTSDPAIKLLQVSAYAEGLLRNRINQSILACMIQFATGTNLDNLALLFGIKRKLIQAADPNSIPPKPAIWESDDDLRKRVLEAPLGFSVAGPRSSYEYHGKLASDKVRDISAESPNPGEVVITVLSYDANGLPSDDLITAVTNKLSDEDIRPLGDRVTINKADIVEFEVQLNLALIDPNNPDSQNIINTIKQNIQSYVDIVHVLGGEVAISGIYAAAHIKGVTKEADVISPSDNIKTTTAQAPYCTNISINPISGKVLDNTMKEAVND